MSAEDKFTIELNTNMFYFDGISTKYLTFLPTMLLPSENNEQENNTEQQQSEQDEQQQSEQDEQQQSEQDEPQQSEQTIQQVVQPFVPRYQPPPSMTEIIYEQTQEKQQSDNQFDNKLEAQQVEKTTYQQQSILSNDELYDIFGTANLFNYCLKYKIIYEATNKDEIREQYFKALRDIAEDIRKDANKNLSIDINVIKIFTTRHDRYNDELSHVIVLVGCSVEHNSVPERYVFDIIIHYKHVKTIKFLNETINDITEHTNVPCDDAESYVNEASRYTSR